MHGDTTMQKITPCLWFNDQAEEAARFYISIFTNSTIGEITHYGEGSPRPRGSVLTVRFQLDGQEFLALNGGPQFTFTEAVSFMVHCETQEELDRMWAKLSDSAAARSCASVPQGRWRGGPSGPPSSMAATAATCSCCSRSASG
jgi:predicted 3-demethylubiquinone-9 3-methyltransferase (glyoxalase superfamily)